MWLYFFYEKHVNTKNNNIRISILPPNFRDGVHHFVNRKHALFSLKVHLLVLKIYFALLDNCLLLTCYFRF